LLNPRLMLRGLPYGLNSDFFTMFARFEYAVKKCGFLVDLSVGDVARASRQKLAEALGPDFIIDVKQAGGAATLFDSPPKELVVGKDNALHFDCIRSKPPETTLELLDCAWRFRDNLFHDNMTNASMVFNKKLMRNVMWLIEYILDRRADLRNAYDER
jgi:hypothetical protein